MNEKVEASQACTDTTRTRTDRQEVRHLYKLLRKSRAAEHEAADEADGQRELLRGQGVQSGDH